ncbi:MAG TPA: response regulator, partial [Rhizomicrobium sp.]
MSGGAFEYLKALIVEDNQHMRALLRSLLNALGIAQVFEATNGEDAFALLRDKQPDLILSDLSMTPVDGIAFVREVRNSQSSPNPYIPIIMVTGHTERHRIEAARDAGV